MVLSITSFILKFRNWSYWNDLTNFKLNCTCLSFCQSNSLSYSIICNDDHFSFIVVNIFHHKKTGRLLFRNFSMTTDKGKMFGWQQPRLYSNDWISYIFGWDSQSCGHLSGWRHFLRIFKWNSWPNSKFWRVKIEPNTDSSFIIMSSLIDIGMALLLSLLVIWFAIPPLFHYLFVFKLL